MHLSLPLGGPDWYSFVGAPQAVAAMAAAGMLRPVVFSFLIASILVVFASYAFSALGFIRPLPALRVVLCAIGVGLSIRAVWLPVLAVTDPRVLGFVCGRCSNFNGFVVATSMLCLFIGLGFLLGALRLISTPQSCARGTDAPYLKR